MFGWIEIGDTKVSEEVELFDFVERLWNYGVLKFDFLWVGWSVLSQDVLYANRVHMYQVFSVLEH